MTFLELVEHLSSKTYGYAERMAREAIMEKYNIDFDDEDCKGRKQHCNFEESNHHADYTDYRGSAYYADYLDLDQQSEEFWDSIT